MSGRNRMTRFFSMHANIAIFPVFFALFILNACSKHGVNEISQIDAGPPKSCDRCASWNQPQEPFRIFGNTFYVGTTELSAILITSDAGHILLDGALPQSAPLIDNNIQALGFKTEDIKVIANSHAHFDHAGGIAALQTVSGARVLACERGAQTLEAGVSPPDDPQYGFGEEATSFPPVVNVHAVTDGQTTRLGKLHLTAHCTPGHTPGSASWSWRACEAGRCENIVYADSLNAVSAPGFLFSDDAKNPDLVGRFRASIKTVSGLPCTILLTPHPGFMDLSRKLKRLQESPGSNPFIDPSACKAYARLAEQKLDDRIAREKSNPN